MQSETGRVHGKVAVITGAGSGIGLATARLLAAEGAVVVLADIAGDAARFGAKDIVAKGGRAAALELDVSDDAQWRRTIDAAVAEHGRLDVLVNNAGISISKPVSDLSLLEWRKVMAVNLDGVFLGTKYAVEAMRKTGGGSIVNIASVSGVTPGGGAAAYCASKAAVRMLSRTVAIECADARTGIRVNTVTPGGVTTPMWEKESFFRTLVEERGGTEEAFAALAGEAPSQQFFSPEEIARTILYLASDESSHLSGIEIIVDGGHTG